MYQMKFKSKDFLLAVLIIGFTAANIAWFWYNTTRAARIAYVRSPDVIEQYYGMKEIKDIYGKKLMFWQTELDSLAKKYEENKFLIEKKIASTNSSKIRDSLNSTLQLNLQKVLEYKQNLDAKAKNEEDKLTQGALNQINSFVKEYSEEHGFSIVLGTTLSGNILYAKDTYDITDDLIKELNKNYLGNTN